MPMSFASSTRGLSTLWPGHTRTSSNGSASCASAASTADTDSSSKYEQVSVAIPDMTCSDIVYPSPFVVKNGFIDALSDRPPSLEVAYHPNELLIKNTFLNFEDGRPPSLEGFYEDRKVRSCPVSAIKFDAIPEAGAEAEQPQQQQPLLEEKTRSASAAACRRQADAEFAQVVAECVAYAPVSDISSIKTADEDEEYFGGHADPVGGRWAAPTPTTTMQVQGQQGRQVVVPPPGVNRPARQVLSLAEAVAAPPQDVAEDSSFPTGDEAGEQQQVHMMSLTVGTPECPTKGSVGHHAGCCKPCAFSAKGCSSGADCGFCHLCEPGEKKRRKKEKQQFRKEVIRWRQSLSDAWKYSTPSGAW